MIPKTRGGEVRAVARNKERPWYKLDNAAILYSALQREEYSAVYRFLCGDGGAGGPPPRFSGRWSGRWPRFPGFGVRIKKGAFWYYFEPNPAPGPFVKEDIANPCQPIRFREDNGWLVRFYYYERRISIEVFHALSDGGGALVFFRTLLAVYLGEMGHPIPKTPGLLDVDEPPRREELEDAYARYATVRPRRARLEGKAYPNTGTAEPFYTLNVTMGFVPVDALKARAKSYGVSITEYLSAALIRVILDNQARENPRKPLPVALAIPIDLRRWFPTQTLRNFILTARPCIDPALGEYTFAEIAGQVHHYLRLHINRQEMQAPADGQCALPDKSFTASNTHLAEKSGDGAELPPGGVPALLCDLHQSGGVLGAAGDGSPYPAYGGHPGSGHQPQGPLCLHQLRQYHVYHLCRDGAGDGHRAGFLPFSGQRGDSREGGEQPPGGGLKIS